ncbi:MAG TPA: LLM class flavin-dependent oxidoreductase [Actinomycetota bacterium]|jgi:alkanesulfonate monooxygenase SsuD/methylene tetrahydromethanopterin reductase-like flavin-dependent oxidoreductase (luciferase family)
MQFAVGVPNVREYGDPHVLMELGRHAEAAGWGGFFIWDHLVYREPGDPVCDPWVALTAVATTTTRMRLGIMVCALARRRPWMVARTAAAIDVLSDGRLVFGAGLGSLGEGEFTAFGEEGDDRARADRLDEGLEIVTGLWSGEPFSFHGRHYRVDETAFRPVPAQRSLPVWIAGRWPSRRPFRRAARWNGLFATHHEVALGQTMTPGQLDEIVRYTLDHRVNEGSFDVVMEGTTDGPGPAEAARVSAYADVGLTWWVEQLNWARGSLDATRARIDLGPPGAIVPRENDG